MRTWIRGFDAVLVAGSLLLLTDCRSQPQSNLWLPPVGPYEERVAGCIDPTVESMAWRLLAGKLEGIQSESAFTLKLANGNKVRVSIANIGTAPTAQRSVAQQALRQILSRGTIEVMANWSYEVEVPEDVAGEVHVENDDVAERLLAAGLVSFAPAKPYQVSQYSECVHRNAESYAKEKRRGIWAVR